MDVSISPAEPPVERTLEVRIQGLQVGTIDLRRHDVYGVDCHAVLHLDRLVPDLRRDLGAMTALAQGHGATPQAALADALAKADAGIAAYAQGLAVLRAALAPVLAEGDHARDVTAAPAARVRS